MALLNVSVRLWRPPAGFGDLLDRSTLAIIATGIVVVWLIGLKYRRTFNKLQEKTDEKATNRLRQLQRQTSFWVYLIALQTVLLMRHQ